MDAVEREGPGARDLVRVRGTIQRLAVLWMIQSVWGDPGV